MGNEKKLRLNLPTTGREEGKVMYVGLSDLKN